MVKSKKLLKLLSLFATFAFVLFCMAPAKVDAIYEQNKNIMLTGKNQFVVDPTSDDNQLVITIQYQYGLRDIQVFICNDDLNAEGCETDPISSFIDYVSWSDPTQGMNIAGINQSSQETTTYAFTKSAPTDGGVPISEYANGSYRVLVKASFCTMRTADKSACASDDNWTEYKTLYFDIIEIKGAFTGNSEVNGVIAKVLTIVNDYVIPVLWIALFVVLIVRGVILAIGIVKASDEAEVRSAKIKGMVWLVVGVFAGYALTIGASWIMTIFGYGGIFS
jgi:hypothetical protein